MSDAATAAAEFARSRIRGTGHRLVPSQFPPIGIFDSVATPEDAIAAMTLEGFTNARLQLPLARARLLAEDDWVVGQPGATIVMAAFLHAAPDGGRFSSGTLGAWYAARTRDTAISETIYHQTRRLRASPALGMTASMTMREWIHKLDSPVTDLRGARPHHKRLYDANSYAVSQPFGESLRASGSHGIVYDSVRHPGGTCVVLYKPRAVVPLQQGAHIEYRWSGTESPTVILLQTLRTP